jgi:radical SAM protein with 4Fe4S-binding SPASM domain
MPKKEKLSCTRKSPYVVLGRFVQRNHPVIFSKLYNFLDATKDFAVNINYNIRIGKRSPIRKGKVLDTLTFSLTNVCNASCIFCPYELLHDKKEFMKFPVFKKALDQFIEQGGKHVSFTPIFGEALLDNDLFNKINYCKKKGVNDIFLFTNGILLNKNYKQIVDSGLDKLIISFSEFDSKKYCEVYRVTQKVHKELIEGLEKLLKYNEKKGHKVHITLALRPSSVPKNVMKNSFFVNNLKKYLDDVAVMTIFNSHNGKIKQENLKGVMRIKRPFRNKNYPCVMLYEMVTLLPNGDVKLCGCTFHKTLNEFVIGNINDQDIFNIYNGDKANNLRKNFKNNPLCKKCTIYKPYRK